MPLRAPAARQPACARCKPAWPCRRKCPHRHMNAAARPTARSPPLAVPSISPPPPPRFPRRPAPKARPYSSKALPQAFRCGSARCALRVATDTTEEGGGGSAPSCALATPRMVAATNTRIGHVGQLPRATTAVAGARRLPSKDRPSVRTRGPPLATWAHVRSLRWAGLGAQARGEAGWWHAQALLRAQRRSLLGAVEPRHSGEPFFSSSSPARAPSRSYRLRVLDARVCRPPADNDNANRSMRAVPAG